MIAYTSRTVTVTNAQISDLPGFGSFGVEPKVSSSSKHGSFVFGKANKPINKLAFIEVSNQNSFFFH